MLFRSLEVYRHSSAHLLAAAVLELFPETKLGHVGEAELLEVVADAARDMHRTIRLLERRGQSKDHPILPLVPETSYLKCLILSVSH